MLITATLPAALAITITGIAGHETDAVCIALASERTAVPCPLCNTLAQRVHSRYQRTLADLPWQGCAGMLLLQTRRFFCDDGHCAQRIFAERFPGLVPSHRRRSVRLTALYSAVGLALGGEPGARLVRELGLTTSPDTLLRLVRALSTAATTPVRVLAVDDWAKRRGHTYGTILVDLERHAVIDLLPDREAATFSAWLQEHPEVEIISRDRASAYAEGARDGAPQAVQVADRFHLLKNVGDALERILHGQPEAVRTAAPPDSPAPALDAAASAETASTNLPTPSDVVPTGQGDRRLQERYAQVTGLAATGLTIRAIRRETGLSRMTIRTYLRATACPERAPQPGLLSPGSRWERVLRERWDAGCQNAATLWQELRTLGFPGSAGTVRRHVGGWRTMPRRRGQAPTTGADRLAAAPVPVPSPRQVKWWLLADAETLTDEQRAYLQRLLVAVPALTTAQQLAKEFGRIIRERDGAALGDWLDQAERSGISELRAVAVGMRRDRAAIAAALVLPWSQGQTEGQVNKRKLVKRQMYGRGGLDLLRGRLRRGA